MNAAYSSQAQASERVFAYRKVYDLLRTMIEKKVLRPGDRMPSLRKLSQQLGFSVITITNAYRELESEGLIQARSKSGFYVRPPTVIAEQTLAAGSLPGRPLRVRVKENIEAVLDEAQARGVKVPLALADIQSGLFPLKDLVQSIRSVLRRWSTASLIPVPSNGLYLLRRQIAERLLAARAEIGPEDVIITNSATEALALALRVVASPGDTIAVETPTYFGILRLIEHLGMFACELPMDPEFGIRLDGLPEILDSNDVKAVFASPNFSNPSGALMSDAGKKHLTQLLGERGIALIEDDVFGEFYHGRRRPPLCRAFDDQGLVISCGSLSKSYASGYRLGWMLPGKWMEDTLRTKQILSSSTSTLPQLVFADFMQRGGANRHMEVLRRTCRIQLQKLREAVHASFPADTRMSSPRGGYLLWVQLPRGLDCRLLFEAAVEEGIALMPGTLFSLTGKYRNFIRLSAGVEWSQEIEDAVARIGVLATRFLAEGS